MNKVILYSGKLWRGKILANLANRQRFAKLKPSNLVVIIITLWLYLSIRQTFPRQNSKRANCQSFTLPNFPAIRYFCVAKILVNTHETLDESPAVCTYSGHDGYI